MLRHISALVGGHLQGAHEFLTYAVYASTYVAGILHIILK